ncbi:MAG: hypothetical protein ACI89G_001291 [Minisyncoccia bacterium]|jgi:hypothetical protein
MNFVIEIEAEVELLPLYRNTDASQPPAPQ